MYYLYLIILHFTYGFLNKHPFIEGKWILRVTNDNNIKNSFTFIDIQTNNLIKIKTIKNDILSRKISRTAYVKLVKNNKFLIKNIFNNDFDNNYDIKLIINNVNTYSYSIFGLEIPQIKYNQKLNYNVTKILNVKHKNNAIYVTDLQNNYYYIFDLNTDFYKLPFIEITLTTLFLTKIFDILIAYMVHY